MHFKRSSSWFQLEPVLSLSQRSIFARDNALIFGGVQMSVQNKRIRRRQTIVFVVILFILGASLIFFSLAINPSVKFLSQEFWAGFVRDVGFLFAPTAVLTLLYESLAETKDTKEVSDDILDVIRKELEVRLPISKAHEDILAIY